MSIVAMAERGAHGASVPAPRGDTDSLTIDRGAGDAARPEPSDDPWVLLARYRVMAVAADAACAGAIGTFALSFRGDAEPRHVLYSALVPVTWLAVLAFQRAYEFRFLGTGTEEYRRVLDAGLMLFLTIAVTSFAIRGDIDRGCVVTVVPATVALTLMARKRLRRWLFRLRRGGVGVPRVLVVGRADAAKALAENLDHEPEHSLRMVAACVGADGVRLSDLGEVPVVGDPAHVLEAVDATGAHVVAVTSPPDASGHALRRLSWELEDRGVELVVSHGIVEGAGPRLSIRPVAGLSLLHLERPTISAAWSLAKGTFDRVFAGVLLLVLSPLLAAIALAVRGDLARAGAVPPDPGRRGRRAAHDGQVPLDGGRRRAAAGRGRAARRRQGRAVQGAPGPPGDPGGGMDPAVLPGRDAPAGQRAARRDVPGRPAPTAAARGGALRGRHPPPARTPRPDRPAAGQRTQRPLTWEESLRLDLRSVDNWSLTLALTILWRTWRAVLQRADARSVDHSAPAGAIDTKSGRRGQSERQPRAIPQWNRKQSSVRPRLPLGAQV